MENIKSLFRESSEFLLLFVKLETTVKGSMWCKIWHHLLFRILQHKTSNTYCSFQGFFGGLFTIYVNMALLIKPKYQSALINIHTEACMCIIFKLGSVYVYI